jgi:hypothetical protein
VAGLVRDELEKHKAKLARFKHAAASATPSAITGPVAEVEMKGAETPFPAAPAAHRKETSGAFEFKTPARSASMTMMMSHRFSPLMHLRYILIHQKTSAWMQWRLARL